MSLKPRDAVDLILEQWHQERPDLDVSPMGPIGRIKRCALLLERRLEQCFSQYGLTNWEFDVLATLRRSGAPYRLAPTALFSSLMVTSGTMTHRMQQLTNKGLVSRIANSNDARSTLVQLTSQGLALIDRAVEAHLENERKILSELKPSDVATLDNRLAKLLASLE